MEYPDSLTKVSVDLGEVFYPREEKLIKFNPDYQVAVDWEGVKDALEAVLAVEVADWWYSRFGPSYWSGIFSMDPWWRLLDLLGERNIAAPEEEAVWGLILQYHVVLDMEAAPPVLSFQFNTESPINAWLRTHSQDGDVPINVQTLLEAVVNTVLHIDEGRRESKLFTFTELGYCPQCHSLTGWYDDWGCCLECGTQLEANYY